ncbi:MAG TPA: general stress protein [Leptolyngbyaceae cyanobacterium]
METAILKHGIGVFAKSQAIEQAIHDLKAANFPTEKISVLAKDAERTENLQQEVQTSDRIGKENVDTTGAIGDTLSATSWGTLLIGLSSLALPGLGTVLAAGSVGVALVSSIGGVAVSAAATQNLVNALGTLGIPEDRARVYSDRLQQSNYLLIVDGSEEEIHRAESILRQHGIEYWDIYNAP